MPKYYCEYCDIYLTHSSPGGRRQHNAGRKHINNKIDYFMNLIRDPNFQPPAYIIEMGGGINMTGMNSMLGRPGANPAMIRPPPLGQMPWAAGNPLMIMMGRGANSAVPPPLAGPPGMLGRGNPLPFGVTAGGNTFRPLHF